MGQELRGIIMRNRSNVPGGLTNDFQKQRLLKCIKQLCALCDHGSVTIPSLFNLGQDCIFPQCGFIDFFQVGTYK